MHIEQFREYCLAKPGASEDFPFDEVTLCLKVVGKIFAIVGLDREGLSANLKCDPDYAVELRERYPEIQPGWHMNKKHWNTVDFTGSLDDAFLKKLTDHSYDMVVKTLKKAEKEALANAQG